MAEDPFIAAVDMDEFYRANATPDKAARDLADLICSMMRAVASDQPTTSVTKGCQHFSKLMKTLSFVEGMSTYDLINGAAAIMRERAEENEGKRWKDASARGTMHFAELCDSRDSFSNARRSKAESRFIETADRAAGRA